MSSERPQEATPEENEKKAFQNKTDFLKKETVDLKKEQRVKFPQEEKQCHFQHQNFQSK